LLQQHLGWFEFLGKAFFGNDHLRFQFARKIFNLIRIGLIKIIISQLF
jgi:hypothetical protein